MPPEPAAAAVKRPKRLFTKNTGLCIQAARRSIGSDACPVLEGHAEGLAHLREAPKPSPSKRRP